MLELLEELYQAGLPLELTREEYQDLCIEVMNQEEWDDLILNHKYKDTTVTLVED